MLLTYFRLHAHAIYSDVISFVRNGSFLENTLDHFRRSSIYYSFSTNTSAMEELEWLPIKDLLLYRDSIMTYKCIHGMAPYYLTSKFCNRVSIHGRNTRNCDQLQIPLYTSAAGQRSFKFRGAKIWNSLDTDLKEHKSLKNFKLALKSRLFSHLYK